MIGPLIPAAGGLAAAGPAEKNRRANRKPLRAIEEHRKQREHYKS
jgi:hypothetical protein